MSGTFDAYHKWLAIPPKNQPPDHYRLLGIELFETDADVISGAADRRMAHLRSFQSGKYSKLSQKILNEVSAARLCLLNPDKKAEYDAELRAKLRPQQPAAPEPPPVPPPKQESPSANGADKIVVPPIIVDKKPYIGLPKIAPPQEPSAPAAHGGVVGPPIVGRQPPRAGTAPMAPPKQEPVAPSVPDVVPDLPVVTDKAIPAVAGRVRGGRPKWPVAIAIVLVVVLLAFAAVAVLSPEGPQADEGQPANTLLPERAEVKPQIPDSAEQFRGHYYDVFETPMTWHCARDFCQRLGGHLARVQSAEEQDFVAGLVGKKADFWVDGSDELEEGVWKFSDGRPCTFTNWQKGQPSNRDGKQHVLMVRADHNGQWNDGHSAARKPFVCEWDPERGSAPTPSEPPGGRTAEPEDTASFGGHRYKLYESTVPRHIAREQCRTMGGHLAQIESAEEQKFIEELLRPGEQKLYWVDGSDAAAEGEWTFSDGSKISYTNWASKEPNNSDKVQHSLNIYRENGKHGKWDDCGAGVRCGFIAEWDR